MRKLLLGLLPIACTVAGADSQPRIAAPPSPQPIIEKGSGCGPSGQDIATDGRAPRSKGRVVRSDDADEGEADYERAPMKKPASRPSAPSPEPAADASPRGGRGPIATGGAIGGRPGAPPPPPSKIAARPPMQQPDGVRAGEWDDNANYRDYVKWLASSATKGKIDITGRQFLVVTDSDGKAMPNVPVTITGSQGSAKLVTMSSGRAILFPTAFGLSGDLTASVTYQGATATAKLSTKTVDGVAKLELPRQRTVAAKRVVDLAFVLDTTGSMSEEIDAVKQTIKAVSDQLSTAQTDVRIGLVEYKDRSDCMLTRTFPFSSDLRAFGASIANVSASGGGDMPEDMHKGLDAALDKLMWRGDASTRMIVVIADAPPQFYAQSNDYANSAKRAAARGIKLYTVAASGMDNLGQVVMRQMSQFTGASNMFVLRGGAGPQSVGGGDPKSSCGGTHQDFSSGKLDQLIMRKVRQELASIDADPMKIPGRGQDENAKPCEQRLVVAN
jgi:hypothetical protein